MLWEKIQQISRWKCREGPPRKKRDLPTEPLSFPKTRSPYSPMHCDAIEKAGTFSPNLRKNYFRTDCTEINSPSWNKSEK